MNTTERNQPATGHDLPSAKGAFVFATVLALAAAVAFRIADTMGSLYAGVVDAAGYGALIIAAMAAATGLVAFIVESVED